MITMTPKNIMNKFLSVPIYSTSGVIALAGLFFIVPGGIFILGALCLCWLGDRLISSKGGGTDFATTIEEYEEHMTEDDYRNDPDVRDNERIWTDFYGDKL